MRQDLQGIVGYIKAHQSSESTDFGGQVRKFVVGHVLKKNPVKLPLHACIYKLKNDRKNECVFITCHSQRTGVTNK